MARSSARRQQAFERGLEAITANLRLALFSPRHDPPIGIEEDAGRRGEEPQPLSHEFLRALGQGRFVVNLAPREIKGIISEGMLFDIGYADGVFAVPEKPVPDGRHAG